MVNTRASNALPQGSRRQPIQEPIQQSPARSQSVQVEDLDEQGNTVPQGASYSNRQQQHSADPVPNYDAVLRGFLDENRENLRRYMERVQVPPQPQPQEEQGSVIRNSEQHRPNQGGGAHRLLPHGEAHRLPPQQGAHRRINRTEFDKYGLYDVPFSQEIVDTPLPRGYRLPNVDKYDGLKDPQDFLSQYKYSAMNQQLGEVHMCKLFPELLMGNARKWFSSLPRGSISSYADLLDAFYRRFLQRADTKTSPAHLLNMRQGRDEPIKDYMFRFNQECLGIEDQNDLLIISAFQNGLQPGALYKQIVEKEPKTLAELWSIADLFAKVDDADRKKREFNHPEPSDKKKDEYRGQSSRSIHDRLQRPPVQTRLGPQRIPIESRLGPRQGPEHNRVAPLTKSRAEIYELHSDLFGSPRPMLKGPKRRAPNKYCAYHKDHGHTTEDCRNLEADVEELVQIGTLRKYQARTRAPQQKTGKRKQDQGGGSCAPEQNKKGQPDDEEDDESPPAQQYDGEISTIVGLPHGTTRSSQKSEARRPPTEEPTQKRFHKEDSISFTDDDPVPAIIPHNDAIVIKVVVANKLVHRVHVDTGASVSILFKECFDQLDIGDAHLEPAKIPLRSFAQDETLPEGVVSFPITVGDDPMSSTQIVRFYVVKASSPYNLILGRDWLNSVKAICSTYHLTIKLPTKKGIAAIRGDQKRAKECMQVALKRTDPTAKCPQA